SKSARVPFFCGIEAGVLIFICVFGLRKTSQGVAHVRLSIFTLNPFSELLMVSLVNGVYVVVIWILLISASSGTMMSCVAFPLFDHELNCHTRFCAFVCCAGVSKWCFLPIPYAK